MKHIIIKSKGDGLVCLGTDMEKPEKIIPTNDSIGSYDHYYPAKYKQWLESFKEYPVRKEDIKEVLNYLLTINDNHLKEYKIFQHVLSQGIEIDSDLVDITKMTDCKNDDCWISEKCCYPNKCPNKQYAVLVLPEEEVSDNDLWKELFALVDRGEMYLKSKFTLTRKTK